MRAKGPTPARMRKIQDWEERVHETGATLEDVAGLEKILKWAIIMRDIAGEDFCNTEKYWASRWNPVELICYNGHF